MKRGKFCVLKYADYMSILAESAGALVRMLKGLGRFTDRTMTKETNVVYNGKGQTKHN